VPGGSGAGPNAGAGGVRSGANGLQGTTWPGGG